MPGVHKPKFGIMYYRVFPVAAGPLAHAWPMGMGVNVGLGLGHSSLTEVAPTTVCFLWLLGPSPHVPTLAGDGGCATIVMGTS